MNIPTLDLQHLDLNLLDTACRDWGFFALRGHDISAELKRAALTKIEWFFLKPKTYKNQIRRSEKNCWGYFDAELTKNRQDWKEILDIGFPEETGPLAGAYPQWPDDGEFIELVGMLREQLHTTAITVARAVIASLDADLDVSEVFQEHSSFLRLNYYPPCPTPYQPNVHGDQTQAGELGISHHSDAGAVTVLMQDEQPGLQVLHQGQWRDVPAQSDALIINIGDIVQVWSNDRYPAPLHRVLANSTTQRISTPYFLNPDYKYNYQPLVPGEVPKYQAINWGEFRAKRSAGDYADYGSEVQISNYRTSPAPAASNPQLANRQV